MISDVSAVSSFSVDDQLLDVGASLECFVD